MVLQDSEGERIFAGLGGLIITGFVIGISLLFPFLIPIFASLLYCYFKSFLLCSWDAILVKLAQGWWEVLDACWKVGRFC